MHNTLYNRIKQGLALALILAGLVYLLDLGIEYISQPIIKVYTIREKGAPDVIAFIQYETGRTATEKESADPLSIENKIISAFPEMPEIMLAIARAESNLNPDALNYNANGSTDAGIFQINSIHGENIEELKNADHNISMARKILDRQGLRAWVAYSSGAYLKYL